jgi:hypothetical protein
VGANAAPALATTVAQAQRGSAVFTGCNGDWGVGPTDALQLSLHTQDKATSRRPS